MSLLRTDFIFLGYKPRSGISGSHGSSIFNFSSNLRTSSHNGCADLRAHQQCEKLSFTSHSPQRLSLT
jgi:hypothetical protein